MNTSTSILGISDHAMIVTDIDIIPQYVKQRQRKFYIFSKANWDNIQEDMCKLSDSIMNSVKGSSIEELWKTFKDVIQHSIDRNIPSKVCLKPKSLPWFSSNFKKMVRCKSRLYRRAKKPNQWSSFKSFQKHCKKAFKSAELNHINDKTNSKPFWRYVKYRRQDTVGVPSSKGGTGYQCQQGKGPNYG